MRTSVTAELIQTSLHIDSLDGCSDVLETVSKLVQRFGRGGVIHVTRIRVIIIITFCVSRSLVDDTTQNVLWSRASVCLFVCPRLHADTTARAQM